ncbi:MAG: TldD/PmbA family protein [Nanoarchaeota archaeon]|nr:TldD/PmbA family protein [Nanoarchaeota archaeon]MBU1445503.1 TldD/PmbA family protein [Nanoarchaeota archaeon]MBU2406418.1 TldD/PmbA family protein [Nanoarchaeota archaeon]MBU2420685.1 TldD/PmbA family protein [Nanoarchaeota archaeon]MBU2475674.1 TldD/PmbA family protein [Nanoarchaeota archaeon]
MQKDLADFTIKYLEKKGASYSEARLMQIDSSNFLLKNGNPEYSNFGSSSGLAIRFIKNNVLRFCSTNILEKNKIKTIIESALKLSNPKISKKTEFSDFLNQKAKYVVKQKKKLADMPPEKKLDLLKEIDSNFKDLLGRYFELGDDVTKKYFINSEGTKVESEIPTIGFLYFLTISEKNKTIQRYLEYGSCSGYEILKKWNLIKNMKKEVEALKNNLNHGIKPPKGKIDIIAGPEVTGIACHEACGHPYEADRIFGRESAQAGESFVTEKMIDTRIGSDVVTIVDDPTIENSYGFYKYDDEGVKARRKILMKKGFIHEFLHDRETSKQMNLKSNGSARAVNTAVEPLVRMSNTFMLPGKQTEEELIEGIKHGVFIKNFMEWNIDDKRFNQKYTGSEAYLIKNGKIDKPVIHPSLEITTPALFSSIDAVANNLKLTAGTCGKGEPMQGIPVTMGGPSIRLRRIRLA